MARRSGVEPRTAGEAGVEEEFDDFAHDAEAIPAHQYDDDDHEYEVVRRRRRRRSPVRRIVGWSFVLLLVGVLVAGLLAWRWVQGRIDPPGDPGEQVVVLVPDGSTTDDIGELLAAEDVITDASVFRYYIRFRGGGPFQAGTYTLQQNSSMQEAIDVLDAGPAPPPFVEFTVPEGLTLPEITAAMTERHLHAERRHAQPAGRLGSGPLAVPAARGRQPRGLPVPRDVPARRGQRRAGRPRGDGQPVRRRGRPARPGRRGGPARAHPLPGAHRGLAGPGGGGHSGGLGDDRPGHLQPSRAGHPARRRRHDLLRAGGATLRAHRVRPGHRVAVQQPHPGRAAADADRRPGAGGPRGRAQPGRRGRGCTTCSTRRRRSRAATSSPTTTASSWPRSRSAPTPASAADDLRPATRGCWSSPTCGLRPRSSSLVRPAEPDRTRTRGAGTMAAPLVLPPLWPGER